MPVMTDFSTFLSCLSAMTAHLRVLIGAKGGCPPRRN